MGEVKGKEVTRLEHNGEEEKIGKAVVWEDWASVFLGELWKHGGNWSTSKVHKKFNPG